MGLSLKPSDATPDPPPPPETIEDMIANALAIVHHEGGLGKKTTVRMDNLLKIVLGEVAEKYHFKNHSMTLRFLAYVAGPQVMHQGSSTNVLLSVFALLDREERYEALSEAVIAKTGREVEKLRVLGSAGERRAVETVDQTQTEVERWDDDFWRQQTLDRITRELRPLLKGEPPQRPRLVPIPVMRSNDV